MRDLARDLKDVCSRVSGSMWKRDQLLSQAKAYARDLKRSGVDVARMSQLDFVKPLAKAGAGASVEDWMFRLCVVRLLRGDFSDWTGWEYRNEWAVGSYWKGLNKPRWRLEGFLSIAILGEQGIGDEIMFASCIPDVQKRIPKVTIECDPRLQAVFARSFGVETRPRLDVIERDNPAVKYLSADRPEACFLPSGDLPRLFRKSRESFPGAAFLKPLPEYVEKWKHYKGRTGFAWRGRSGQIKPEAFQLDNPVCLQYDHWEHETKGMEVPPINLKDDIEDILGICANLERVVTVGQTIVHLAASIGTPVEVVMAPVDTGRVHNQFNYRYGESNYMPWYSQVMIHRNLEQFLADRRPRPFS